VLLQLWCIEAFGRAQKEMAVEYFKALPQYLLEKLLVHKGRNYKYTWKVKKVKVKISL
jgi:hypothetical protein